MTENTIEENTNENTNDIAFNMQKIYVKDVSFEAPGVPESFKFEGGYKPNIDLELNTNNREVFEDTYEVTINVTVTAKSEENVLFLVEVKQSGVFSVRNMDEEAKNHTLGSFCPSILFPYARQTISTLILDGGFPQLLLAHINFDQLYFANLERQKKAEQQGSEASSEDSTIDPTSH